jgi:hypothetical protein
MRKDKASVPEENIIPAEQEGSVISDEPRKSKSRRFWDYVNDYKRKTVALALPSIVFDIAYSSFLFTMSIITFSLWLFIMSIYHTLLYIIRINVLYRAGRGAVFKGRRFSERINYRKFSRNLILLDAVLALALYLIVKGNVIHDYKGLLVYAFGAYVFYKVLLAVINLFKAQKSSSLTALALRKIGIVDAMVSVLALEWALSHRNEGGLSVFAMQIEKYIGIVVVVIIFIMGAAGLINCIRLGLKERKEGKK